MINELEKAVYQVLVAAQAEGEPLESVPDIKDTDMLAVKSGGITLEGTEEIPYGGSEIRKDFIHGRVEINCIVYLVKESYRAAKIEAEALAKAVRKVLKSNLKLVCTDYPDGFCKVPIRIVNTRFGYGQVAGNMVAVATVTLEAQYQESYS